MPRLTILVPWEADGKIIEVIDIAEENITIRKLPRSYDLNQLKEGWD